MAEFATAWQTADKVVYSTTLTAASTAKTRIERDFDSTAVRELKASASGDITVGGANLASQALKAGLVDECQLYVLPTALGGESRPCLPTRASTSSSSMNADSGTVSCSFGTALGHGDSRPCRRAA